MVGTKNMIRLKKKVTVNREASWLKFDQRVLDQATDTTNPLLERCKFLSIFCSNMDEFFMVRMGRLYDGNISDPTLRENKTGLTSAEQMEGVLARMPKLYSAREKVFLKIKRELKKKDINILTYDKLSSKRKKEAKQYFASSVLPVLSPVVLDAKHPLVRFNNLTTYILYKLRRDSRVMIGVMEINPKLDKLYKFSGAGDNFITMEDLVYSLGAVAFSGYEALNSMLVRVARNANFESTLEDADVEYDFDFSKLMKSRVEKRPFQNAIRAEYKCVEESKTLKKFLMGNLELDERFMFKVEGNLDYKYMFSLIKRVSSAKAAELTYEPFMPKIPTRALTAVSMVDEIRKKDMLLSYPFESMQPLISLLNECADREDCIAIKITIYRLADHSKIVDALKRASENGKEVTVVMELLARFDEENNMYFAKALEEAGCNIIYGMSDYKVHSKIISIVFSSGGEISYITHLGTGNYNESTAKQYTDLNILTADKDIGEDGITFFRNISICNVDGEYKRLRVAPKYLKKAIIDNLDGEIKKAKDGKKGLVIGKMNSLTDKKIIDKFIEASRAGVEIHLIVRGICCLIPGVKGQTENITVKSIVGRFLEHSRVYCFGEGKDRIMYISSADLMTRNTDKRVEIATPVLDKDVADSIYSMLKIMLKDNVKGRVMLSDATYKKEEIKDGEEEINSQEYFLKNL